MRIKHIMRFLTIMKLSNVVPFIWGEAGIGKSQAVKEFSDIIGGGFIDLRLGQMEVGDLVGYPRTTEIEEVNPVTGNKEKRTVMTWTEPEWWPQPGTNGVLFLDEFNRATNNDVIQAMFQLVLGEKDSKTGKWVRKMHTHILPEGWIIICAGNPDSSEYMVQSLDSAMLNRFCQIKLDKNHTDSSLWMQKNLKTEEIWKFVKSTGTKAIGEQEECPMIIKVHPRSWETLDRIMVNMEEEDINSIGLDVIQGCVGEALSSLFFRFYKDNLIKPISADEVLSMEDFEKFKKDKMSQIVTKDKKRTELLSVTLDDLFAKLEKKDYTKQEATNVINFLSLVPPDMTQEFIKRTMDLENRTTLYVQMNDAEPFVDSMLRSFGFEQSTIDRTVKDMEDIEKEIEEEEKNEGKSK